MTLRLLLAALLSLLLIAGNSGVFSGWLLQLDLALAGLVCVALLWLMLKRLRDRKYDLAELHRLEDRDFLAGHEEMEISNAAEVLCLHCGEVYSARLPVCPACRRGP